MAKSTLEQLKQLSPLAAAIAFSASLPSLVQAEDFLVTSQEDLDTATDAINDFGSGRHSITFTASVSGEQLSMDSLYLYDDGELTIDGAAAKNFSLKVMEKNNDYGVYAQDSDVTISNLSIVEGGNAGDGYVVYAWEDSNVTLENVNITAASVGSDYDEGTIWIDNSNATISNSSFTGLSGWMVVGFRSNDYNNSSITERSLTITNSSFADNYSAGGVVFVAAEAEGLSMVSASLSGLSFNNNESNEGDVVYVQANSDINNGKGSDVTLDFNFINSSITNNTADDLISIYAETDEGDYGVTLNANIANVSIVNNNVDEDGAISIEHDYEGDEPPYLNVNLAHLTIANNTMDNGSTHGVYVESDEDGLVSVNIINSIITNNTYSYEEGEGAEITVDVNLYSETEINVLNSLIGMEAPAEGEGFISGEAAANNNLFDVDAKLGELTLDKKSGTMYASLLKGSPALNAGTEEFNEDIAGILGIEAADLIDQLGRKRSAGSAPDMGAVEKGKSSSSSSGLGSFGFGSVLAAMGLLGFRRKQK